MNIIYLKGIYPLKNKINLSPCLEIDNPRKGIEYEIALNFLKYQLFSHKTADYSNDSQAIYNASLINDAYQKLNIKTSADQGADQKKLVGEPIEVLARSWLIARYKDQGLWRKYYEEKAWEYQNKAKNFFKKHDAEILHQDVTNHLYFLTLPITDEITSYEKTIVLANNEFSIQSILLSTSSNYKFNFRTIVDRVEDIKVFSQSYESAKDILEEKIKYISKILRDISDSASRINDIQLVMLVSIIEFLLTHEPADSSEDSITKQFKLKTSILVKDRQALPIGELGSRLKNIYNLRSKIAHGDFKEVEKIKKKFQSKNIYMCNLIDDMYKYINEVITIYLKDSEYIDYLKNS